MPTRSVLIGSGVLLAQVGDGVRPPCGYIPTHVLQFAHNQFRDTPSLCSTRQETAHVIQLYTHVHGLITYTWGSHEVSVLTQACIMLRML